MSVGYEDRERLAQYLRFLKKDIGGRNLIRALRRSGDLTKIALYLNDRELVFVFRTLKVILEDYIALYRGLKVDQFPRTRFIVGPIEAEISANEIISEEVKSFKELKREFVSLIEDLQEFVSGRKSFNETCNRLAEVEFNVLKLIEVYGVDWRSQYE